LLEEDIQNLDFPLVVKNVRSEPFDVYIGRNNRKLRDVGFSNPFKLYANTERARLLSVSKFAALFSQDPIFQKKSENILGGKLLGCWCSPLLCHGNIFAAYLYPQILQGNILIDNFSVKKLADFLNPSLEPLSKYHDIISKKLDKEKFRVMVSGSRNWVDTDLIYKELDKLLTTFPGKLILIHGGASGADDIANSWAKVNNVPVEVFMPKWEELGKKAGALRNIEMVKSGVDTGLAFMIDNSPGTSHAISLFKKSNIHHKIFEK
jgi:hypothetical protein